ncbi:urease accessory protein UreD [Flindersiella endophytica]
MRATARIVAAAGPAGTTRLTVLRSQSPLLLRRTGAGEVHLVGGAAGPLGGDHLRIEIDVEAGATLVVRTVAASVALPSHHGDWSRTEVTATVAENAALRWLPEPVIAAQGCRHRAVAEIDVTEGGHLLWRDELACGRHGEPGGDTVSRLVVDYGGAPLLAHELAVGPSALAWNGPAVLGEARAAGSLLFAGAGPEPKPETDIAVEGHYAVLPLAGQGTLVTTVAADALALRRVHNSFVGT